MNIYLLVAPISTLAVVAAVFGIHSKIKKKKMKQNNEEVDELIKQFVNENKGRF